MSGETRLASLSERRWPLSPLQEVQLYPDRIESWSGPTLERRIALGGVRRVRLAVEMSGEQSLVVCRVTAPNGEIAFSSRRAEGSGWADQALEFQRLLVAVHKALESRGGEVAYLEGQSLTFRLIMSGAGAVLLAAALAFSGYMLVIHENAVLALAGAPFALVGGALAWVLRPGRPVPYDPARLVERFGG